MNVKLVVVGGDAKAAEIKLRLPTIVGRGRDASLTLPHPLVSRQHCEIFEADGQLVVRDLGSLNGTYINNKRITESVLPPGELLTIGTVTFRAVYEIDPNMRPPTEPAAAASAPPMATPVDDSSEDLEGAIEIDDETEDGAEMEFEDFDDLEDLDEVPAAATVGPPQPAAAASDTDAADEAADDLGFVEVEVDVDDIEDDIDIEELAMDELEAAEDDDVEVDDQPPAAAKPATKPATKPTKAPAGAEVTIDFVPPAAEQSDDAAKKTGDDDDDLNSFFKNLR
jgi:predicted component of type VI protein secretion system